MNTTYEHAGGFDPPGIGTVALVLGLVAVEATLGPGVSFFAPIVYHERFRNALRYIGIGEELSEEAKRGVRRKIAVVLLFALVVEVIMLLLVLFGRYP